MIEEVKTEGFMVSSLLSRRWQEMNLPSYCVIHKKKQKNILFIHHEARCKKNDFCRFYETHSSTFNGRLRCEGSYR